MRDIFKKLFSKKHRLLTESDLIRAESKVGSQVFGHIPAGHIREFFCLNSHTWVWYEEWTDENQQRRSTTTRYEVRPNGVLKVQDGQPHQFIYGQELKNLSDACSIYYQNVAARVYGVQVQV